MINNVNGSSAPYDPNAALMEELANPNLCKSGAVAGVIAAVASLVAGKELDIRQQQATMRSEIVSDQASSVKAEAQANALSSATGAINSFYEGAAEVAVGVKTAKDFKEMGDDRKEYDRKIGEKDNEIKIASGQSDAHIGDRPAPDRDRARLLVAEKEKMKEEFKEGRDAKLARIENHKDLFKAFGKTAAAVGNVSAQMLSSGASFAKTAADFDQALQSSISESEKTSSDTAQSALGLITAAGDLAKASVGR